MVKIIFIVLFFVGSTSTVFAQGYLSLPDSISGVLMQFLIDINDAGTPVRRPDGRRHRTDFGSD